MSNSIRMLLLQMFYYMDIEMALGESEDEQRFGFSVMGGSDEGFPPTIDEVVPGETILHHFSPTIAYCLHLIWTHSHKAAYTPLKLKPQTEVLFWGREPLNGFHMKLLQIIWFLDVIWSVNDYVAGLWSWTWVVGWLTFVDGCVTLVMVVGILVIVVLLQLMVVWLWLMVVWLWWWSWEFWWLLCYFSWWLCDSC